MGFSTSTSMPMCSEVHGQIKMGSCGRGHGRHGHPVCGRSEKGIASTPNSTIAAACVGFGSTMTSRSNKPSLRKASRVRTWLRPQYPVPTTAAVDMVDPTDPPISLRVCGRLVDRALNHVPWSPKRRGRALGSNEGPNHSKVHGDRDSLTKPRLLGGRWPTVSGIRAENEVGPHLAALKTHVDLVTDWTEAGWDKAASRGR